MSDDERDATIVDARGLRCPAPVIRIARAAKAAAPGARLTVLCTDPAAEHDVPAWARMRGHTLVGIVRTGEHVEITVAL